MAKLPSLDHVKYVRAKGRVYAYFNTGQKKDGKPIYARLPDPGAVGFYDSYAAMKGARTKRATNAYTVADMARDFEDSPAFKALARGSQDLYSKTLRRITEHLGKFPVAVIERRHIQVILDHEIKGAGASNIFVGVVGALYKWGRDRGKTDRAPTKGIGKLKMDQHEPWPEDVLEAGLASDDPLIRLAVSLLYFTGQRIGDVLKMRWSDIRKGTIHVVQQKTSKELWIPFLSELKAVLDETPKRGLTIIASAEGRAVGQQSLRPALQAFTLDRGHKTVPHGLRKNAVIAFLEAGCSVAETASITGQTYQMVEHYARRINQQRMAESAVLKLENKRRTGKPIGKQGGES
jgi:integrase